MSGKMIEGASTGFPRSVVEHEAKFLAEDLRRREAAHAVTIAGSIRRGLEVCNDIDLVVLLTTKKQEDAFVEFVSARAGFEQADRWSIERTQLSFGHSIYASDYKEGPLPVVQVDVFVCRKLEEYGGNELTWTGPQTFNVAMRALAKRRGMKLNERGLWDQKHKHIAGGTEQAVFEALKLPFVPPSRRDELSRVDLLFDFAKNVAHGDVDTGRD